MKYRVYIGIINTGYQQQEPIHKILKEGIIFTGAATALERLSKKKLNPEILLKPSFLLAANLHTIKHNFTHPVLIQNTLDILKNYSKNNHYSLMIEKNSFGANTKNEFQNSGYTDALKDRVTLTSFDQEEQACYFLHNSYNSFENKIIAPKIYSKSDFKIYFPKLHTDSTSDGFAGALRAGLENPFHSKNPKQIADFLEISSPNLVITDAIIVPIGGSRITQRGQDLGAVIISNNAVAHDFVACQILNLDPMKIEHLRIAIERGLCPASLQEIELGGAGESGIRLLSQKTRTWRLGHYPLNQLKEKYEYENPGHRFPFEISAQGDTYSENILLDFLNICMDVSKSRNRLSRWTKISLFVGNITRYPSKSNLFTIGSSALNSISIRVAKIHYSFSFFGIKFQKITLKNGQEHFHFHVELADTEFPYYRLGLAFFLVNPFRNRFPIFKLKHILNCWLDSKKNSGKSKKPVKEMILSSTLEQNKFKSQYLEA